VRQRLPQPAGGGGGGYVLFKSLGMGADFIEKNQQDEAKIRQKSSKIRQKSIKIRQKSIKMR
jgi:hypothetical protein